MYKIIISKNAVKDMAHLPAKVTIQLGNAIDKLADNPQRRKNKWLKPFII